MAKPTANPQQVEGYRQAARAALEQNDVDGALEAYGKLLELSPRDQEASEQFGILAGERTQALLKDADRAVRNKQFDRAREALHQVLSIDRNNKPARQRLARMRKAEKGRKVTAVVWACVSVVLVIGLTYAGLWIYNALNFDKAKDLMRQGNFVEAEEFLAKVGRTGVSQRELNLHKDFNQNMIDLAAAVKDHNYKKGHGHIENCRGLLPEHEQIQPQEDDWRAAQENWLTARIRDGEQQIIQNEFDVCRNKTLTVIFDRGWQLDKDPRVQALEKKCDLYEHLYYAESLLAERELFRARGRAKQALAIEPVNERGLHVLKETRMASIAHWQTVASPHAGPVTALAFTGDGRYLCSGGQDGHLRAWDTSNFGKVKEIKIAPGEVFAAAGSPDGKFVAAASFREIPLHQPGSWTMATTLSGHDKSKAVRALAFSPKGDLFAAGSDRRVTVWRTSGFSQVGVAESHTGQVKSVSISPDGEFVASGGFTEDRTVRVYEIRNLSTERKKIDLEGDDQVSAVAFSPDGRYLVFSTIQGRLQVHEAKPPFDVIRKGNDWNQNENITSTAFSNDGQFLVTATSLGTIRVWEMEKFKLAWELKRAHPTTPDINAVAIAPTTFVIATGGFDEIRFWKPEE